MHRSITFTEMLSSTFSTNNEPPADDNARRVFIGRLGIGLIEFFTSTLFFSYGIVFSECVNSSVYTVENGVWTTILYISTWYIAGPWCKSLSDLLKFNRRSSKNAFKYVIIVAALFLSIGVLLPGHILFYGIFGGVCSSMITTHLKQVAAETFKTDPKIFKGNIHCARALSLLITPHVILVLVQNLTLDQSKWILAALLLNIIPAVLIIKPPKFQSTVENPEMTRYHTLPGLSHQMREMVEFTNSNVTSVLSNDGSDDEDGGSVSLQIDSGTENADVPDSVDETEVKGPVQPEQRPPLVPSAVQDYFSKAGVAILPEIPEEKEIEDNGPPNGNVINTKRLSKISAKLEELNQNDTRQEEVEVLNINDLILKKHKSVEDIQRIEYISDYKETNRFLADLEVIKTSCCSCPTYKIFRWRRKIRVFKDFLLDRLFRHLKNPRFYPILVSKCSNTFNSTLLFTIAPYITLKKNHGFKSEDTAFVLSYIAFSWCLFLMLLPLVMTFSEKKLRISYICGLIISGGSVALLCKETVSNDFITINCLMYGFGYGMTVYTENSVYRSLVTKRTWKHMEAALDTLSVILMILVYYFFQSFSLDLMRLFPLISVVTYLSNALLWLAIPITASVIEFIEYRYFKEREVEGGFL